MGFDVTGPYYTLIKDGLAYKLDCNKYFIIAVQPMYYWTRYNQYLAETDFEVWSKYKPLRDVDFVSINELRSEVYGKKDESPEQ